MSNPEKPKEVGKFEQSGMILSSRVVDGVLYLVTEDYASKGHLLPFVTGKNGYKKMDIGDVCTFGNPETLSYIIVSSIDFKTANKIDSQTKAILGASGDIYCNTENLYVACEDYSGGSAVTRLAKTSLDDGSLQFAESGKVRGAIIGQFAMDERDGYFRIATTAEKNGKQVNNLYVLDDELKSVGSVTGFARDEHIEAVRYIGDRAYVITYEQIDPLFVLDLSDPADPQIDGEVEISGFSTQLVPVSGERLVGIGYGTEEAEDVSDADEADNVAAPAEEIDGLKVVLFDISDPSNPKVLDAEVYSDLSSEAQYDHHALLQNPGAGYLAIPYGVDEVLDFEEDAEGADASDGAALAGEHDPGDGGVLVFAADDEIRLLEDFIVEAENVRRCIYIGDYIYALDANDQITAFKIEEP